LERATWALDEADRRLDELAAGRTGWREGEYVPLAYRSRIDGSAQPYGIVVPEGLDRSTPVPVWIWLHGRGERDTDLHFLWQKARKTGEFFPDDCIVLHPFGRYCNGWKGPGAVDVFEALDALDDEGADVAREERHPLRDERGEGRLDGRAGDAQPAEVRGRLDGVDGLADLAVARDLGVELGQVGHAARRREQFLRCCACRYAYAPSSRGAAAPRGA
jgi:hypothetical protein